MQAVQTCNIVSQKPFGGARVSFTGHYNVQVVSNAKGYKYIEHKTFLFYLTTLIPLA